MSTAKEELKVISEGASDNQRERRQERSSSRFLALLFPGLLALLFLLLSFPLLARLNFFWSSLGQRLNYPFFQRGSEGLILSEAALLRAGQDIYVPFRADSFISAPYPPLYYYLVAWLWSDEANLFLNGRLISLGAALAAALFIALGVFFAVPRRPLQRWEWLALGGVGAVAGLLFVSLPAVTIWAARVRADMLMTALQLAGLVLVGAGVRSGRSWLTWAALVPFVLALYTKQTALAGPAAAGVYLALNYGRQWRKTLAWGIGLALAIGLPFIVLNLGSSLELYRRLFKYHNLPWRSENFEVYITLFWQENAALLILSAALLVLSFGTAFVKLREPGIGWLAKGLSAGREIPLVVWYLLASLVLLGGLGVSGADHNHFLPAEAATCLAAGVLAARLVVLPGRWRWVALLAVAGLGLQAAVFSLPSTRYEIEFRVRDAGYQQQMAQIVRNAASRPGPILTSEAAFLVLTGKASPATNYYNDLFTLAALDKQQLYSQAGLLERIRRKEFAFVLAEGDLFNREVRPDVWTPELLAALEENYYRKFADVWHTYEPKP